VGKPGDQKHVHELGLDKMDVSLVMKLMEQGYATRMIIESTDGKIEEFIHPALEMTRHITVQHHHICRHSKEKANKNRTSIVLHLI
jgi:hypothetical protein